MLGELALASIHVVSLGCPKNLVDTEKMLGTLLASGHVLTERASRADVILINTCGFIESAKKEALREITRAIRTKSRNPEVRIVVAGCLVQRYSGELSAEFPEIDGFIGVHDIDKVEETIEATLLGQRSMHVSQPRLAHASLVPEGAATRAPDSASPPMPRFITTPQHMAYLKISEGCDNRCAYCAIPLIRGGMVSRAAEEVLEEARSLVSLGVKEIVLVAQDPTRYGLDTVGAHSLPDLCARMGDIPGVEWIRLMYAHPARWQVALDALVASPRMCKYLDMPVQHASRDVLARMGRQGDAEEYLKAIDQLRKAVPGICLRSTFMVGFPGETDRDFETLVRFIEDARFEYAGVFEFSPEEDTRAASLPGQVDARLAHERARLATEAQQRVSMVEHAGRIGRRARLLVYRRTASGYSGRLEIQAPDIDGVARLVSRTPHDHNFNPGDLVDCEITGYENHDFICDTRPSR